MGKRIESDHHLTGTWSIQFSNVSGTGELVELNIIPGSRVNSFYMKLIINGRTDTEYLVKLPNYDAGDEIQL